MIHGELKVGRNVPVSHCSGQCINPNIKDPPEWMDYSLDIFGCYTPERATRFARRLTGDKTIVINNVEITNTYYAIPMSTFVEVAERINNGN